MIQMARSLNLRTIAEGVEESAMAEQLQVMGCDEAQGYLYAKPLRAEEMLRWLQEGHADPPERAGGERRGDRVDRES
jgi:EAL domain-containing protein (putative c-di-GMP-specific phosphodiesterase class I)